MSERRRGPGMGMGRRPVEKADDFKGSMKKILRYIGRYKIRLFIMFVCAIGGTIFAIVGPKILGKATTELFNGLMAKVAGTGSIDFEKILNILLTVLVLYAVSAVFSFIQGWLMTGISNDAGYRMRRDISDKIHRLPVKYFESRTYGDVLSRITNDVDTLQQGINQSITQLITSAATLIGAFIMMLSINGWMTLCAVLILPVSMFIITRVMKFSQKYFTQQQNYLADVNGQVEENYGGQNIIKAFNREEDAINTFRKSNGMLYESAWKSQFFSGTMMPVMQFVGNIGYVMVALLGGIMVIKNAIEVGEIQSFFQYINNFTRPVQQIAQVVNMLQSSAAAGERVFAFLEEPEEDQQEDATADLSHMQGNVVFDHVSFGYDSDKIIIKDFSADIKAGSQIAIVGPTGAGKTTMAKLLMRFYDVNSGAIYIDGHNIREYNKSHMRNMFGMVLQDTWLFSGTIKENIRYGRLDATDEEVIAAAKAAHAYKFIMQQPQGFDTMINEESSNISQGQKQLLTIARAILADNRIMILDEATSSVDTRTEIRIQKAMDNLMKGRTSFVIAHRLSTIKNADMILVMKDGNIIEQGNHEELLEKNGFYAQLYNSQFEHSEAAAE